MISLLFCLKNIVGTVFLFKPLALICLTNCTFPEGALRPTELSRLRTKDQSRYTSAKSMRMGSTRRAVKLSVYAGKFVHLRKATTLSVNSQRLMACVKRTTLYRNLIVNLLLRVIFKKVPAFLPPDLNNVETMLPSL